ncbi:MAG: tripartite tricarboxylate transporter substrate binding protein [Syntrophales bacterium LBB04]|nr:tripartite tricarboxylate transporter substrate binding protein [Syntrophales bacterium LBB04]
MSNRGKPITWFLRGIWCFIALCVLFFTVIARAEYPERSVTIIVGNEAGGTADLITRALAIGTERQLGKAIIVENKGGGGGAVALGALVGGKPDGYAFCAVPNDALVNTALMQKVPFKPLASFIPIIGHSASENTALLVKSDAPWNSFKEFLEYAKKNPGKVKYSSAGVGTGMHTAMEYVAHQDGIKWVHVPYKGTAPARTALLGGHVDACSSGVDWQPFVQSGQLKVLVTHGRKRLPNFPNVPTLKESGYDFVSDTIHGVVGPAGLPPDIIRKIETAFIKGTETPEFKTTQEKLSLSPVRYDSKEFERHLKEHWVRMEKIFIDTKIIKEAATQPY